MVQFSTCNKNFVEETLASQPEGKNTRFLSASHSLWYRFNNYETNAPFVLYDNKEMEPVGFVFATLSEKTKYMNLYEIVTLEGKEGNGYASMLWEQTMQHAYDKGMRRLKISCTPSSVTWHKRNGLIFWAVDPTGSLRSDQPLFPTRKQQLEFREEARQNPSIALPNEKVCSKLAEESIESHKFGKKKYAQVTQAIEDVKPYWFRDSLLINQATLEEFF